MARKAAEPPLNLTREQIIIRVSVFGGASVIRGEIRNGNLIAGGIVPFRAAEIDVVVPQDGLAAIPAINAALKQLRKLRYENVYLVMQDGSRSLAYAL